jgi:hypothetical protein
MPNNFHINTKVLKYYGFEEAMYGLSLNRKKLVEEMYKVAKRLGHKDSGHNKFLESIIIWVEIRAPRYWWQEFDTYRIGITKQSESTINSFFTDFENSIVSGEPLFEEGSITDQQYAKIEESVAARNIVGVKRALPEGFLQKRVVCMSLKSFRNMYIQRKDHVLPHWNKFLMDVIRGLPESYVSVLGFDLP